MDKQLQKFGSDAWTERKLNILSKYLNAYNKALKYQPFTRVYVDAFAGTGYREQKKRQRSSRGFFPEMDNDAESFRKGSAKRALEVKPSFHRYLFIEIDSVKAAELEKLKEEYPDQADNIQVVCDDANDAIAAYCNQERWRSIRAVMFLDLFATEVRWTTIEKIAATKGIDLWYLFPLMAVNRLLAKNHTKAFRDRLDAVFGGREWMNAFYREQQSGFFPDPDGNIEKGCNMQAIGDYFMERLSSIFAGVAQTRCVLRNSRRSPLFQFFFAASHPLAIKIADDILLREMSDGS